MPRATNIGTGKLNKISDCYISIPHPLQEEYHVIEFDNLPDISDSKNAVYNQDNVIGRSTGLVTYSHSETRQINITLHFFVVDGDFDKYIKHLRALQSVLYPRNGTGEFGAAGNFAPFVPPAVCQIKCGKQLADEPLCCMLTSCQVKFPTDVVWDNITKMPIKFDVDTSWIVVYSSNDLPTQKRIFQSGR